MKILIGMSALVFGAGMVNADISDDFEGYAVGSVPGGAWQDATVFIDQPTHTGSSVSVIRTTDALGNLTNAVQIADHVGTSGGMMSRVDTAANQRFEIDVRFDQRGNGSTPNWMSSIGFVQETVQDDFNWSPQAFVYASGNGRFRLFVQNNDGQGSGARDFQLGNAAWSMDTWFRVSLGVDTDHGVFDIMITNLETDTVIADTSRTYSGWNSDFGQYDLVSFNDGEYGSNPGTIGNMASFDNANYVPAPGVLGIAGLGGLCATRRRR